jgi:hypothetical protein
MTRSPRTNRSRPSAGRLCSRFGLWLRPSAGARKARSRLVPSRRRARPSGDARSFARTGSGSLGRPGRRGALSAGVCSALSGCSGRPASFVIWRPASAAGRSRLLSSEARRPAGGAGRLIRQNRWLRGNLEWFSRPLGRSSSVTVTCATVSESSAIVLSTRASCRAFGAMASQRCSSRGARRSTGRLCGWSPPRGADDVLVPRREKGEPRWERGSSPFGLVGFSRRLRDGHRLLVGEVGVLKEADRCARECHVCDGRGPLGIWTRPRWGRRRGRGHGVRGLAIPWVWGTGRRILPP